MVAGAVDVDREEGRRLAAEELAQQVYSDARPPLVQRALQWLLEQLGRLLPDEVGDTPVAQALLVVAVVVAVLLALRFAGQAVARRRRPGAAEVFDADTRRSAADHRARADRMAADGDWHQAVAERFRAVVRGAEERALLDERPGRTATEAVTELAVLVPDLADPLRAGARTFDDVVYGSAPGAPADDARLRELDGRLQATRPSFGTRPPLETRPPTATVGSAGPGGPA